MTMQPNDAFRGAPPTPAYYPTRPTSGYATAALVFGIAGLFLFFTVVPSIVAVCLGHEASKLTKTGQLGGHGQAVAGLILGYVVVVPAALWLVVLAVGSTPMMG